MSGPDYFAEIYSNIDFSETDAVCGSNSNIHGLDFMEVTADDTQYRTVDVLWCTLGDSDYVVLQAEDHKFRLPPHIFEQKSLVFKNFYRSDRLLSLEFERRDDPSLRGLGATNCASVIKLIDVSAMEAIHFLRALYDPEYFEGYPIREPLEKILSIFEVASRYQVQFLRRRALAHLEQAYPFSCLEDWDRREETSTFPVDRYEYYQQESQTLTSTLKIIGLCSTYNAQWILPSAYYEACLYNYTTVSRHSAWTNGISLSKHVKKEEFMKLYHDHYASQAHSKILSFLHLGPLSNCKDADSGKICDRIRRQAYNKIVNDTEAPRERQDFLGRLWDNDDWEEMNSQGMCDYCLEVCMASHKENRTTLWQKLPGFYGLKDWDALYDIRSSFISSCNSSL